MAIFLSTPYPTHRPDTIHYLETGDFERPLPTRPVVPDFQADNCGKRDKNSIKTVE
jgi:hypothetical protein